jgi:hypothetical protein
MSHNLFERKVTLEPTAHVYTDANGNTYKSVTTLLKELGEKFEDTYAYKNATEEKKAEWKEKGRVAADAGTRIHNALELFAEMGTIEDSNKDLEQAIKSIHAEYTGYHKLQNEICLYHEELKIAGTADRVCLVSNRKDCAVDIADFKTSGSKGIQFYSDYGKKLYPPFEHLHDCNYNKYSFQLSIYAYFFELLTGRKVRQLYIHFIPLDNPMNHKKIPVTYLKNDVKMLFEKYNVDVPVITTNEEGVEEF